jgi:hypothetical protein
MSIVRFAGNGNETASVPFSAIAGLTREVDGQHALVTPGIARDRPENTGSVVAKMTAARLIAPYIGNSLLCERSAGGK